MEETYIGKQKIRTYILELKKQEELEEMSDKDKEELYNHIISNSDLINDTINDTVNLERENVSNYESIRELEMQVSNMEIEFNKKELDENYSDSEKQADNIDFMELKEKLDIFKNRSAEIFNSIKRNNKLITDWKRSITVYLMAECISIKKQVIEGINIPKPQVEKKIENPVEEIPEIEIKQEISKKENKSIKDECKENIETIKKLISDINRLISKQQSFAKIAGNLGASYSALNNAFEMKKNAENLKELANIMLLKIEEGNSDIQKISEVNNQVGVLLNYLNNPKTLIARTKLNRFDEMIIVEENELKRDISKAILNIRGEAELKKLRDDTQIIEDKSTIKKILGIFTGQNKLDNFILSQIELRKNSIKKTLSHKLRLDYNYSIHELIAEIRMFIKDNEDDELVLEDVSALREFEKEISQNFVIIDSKVKDIINEKENKNLPVSNKITKKELIEIETYRFLNKYGYDIAEKQEPEEVSYVDTTAKEISRIIEYINTSKILE